MALVAPTVRGGAQVMSGNNNWATRILGTTPDYLEIRELSMLSGQRVHRRGRGRRRQSRAARIHRRQ